MGDVSDAITSNLGGVITLPTLYVHRKELLDGTPDPCGSSQKVPGNTNP